jgi:chromosome segregation ATPase
MSHVKIINMGKKMFNNEIFENWLDQKAQAILLKIDKEVITDNEMLTLVLKAQTNHFNHLDIDLRQNFKSLEESTNQHFKMIDTQFIRINDEFKRIDERFQKVYERFELIDQRFEKIDERFDKIDQRFEKIDERFEKIDQRFEKIDQRFLKLDEKIDSRFMWTIGLMASGFLGLYLKIFFL